MAQKLSANDFEGFVEDLSAARIGCTFNQYGQDDPRVDRPGGAAMRRANLVDYLQHHRHARFILVGEAPSYRGCRFSGIAFTAEADLAVEQRSSKKSATPGESGWTELSGSVVRTVLRELAADDRVLLWNACPLHPAKVNDPLSNRTPCEVELAESATWLARLQGLLDGPLRLIAVGESAHSIMPAEVKVRHPAHGGAAKFKEQLTALLRVES